jgi:hypothetical protein
MELNRGRLGEERTQRRKSTTKRRKGCKERMIEGGRLRGWQVEGGRDEGREGLGVRRATRNELWTTEGKNGRDENHLVEYL